MTSLPILLDEETRGIVIQAARQKPRRVRFWAYLWAADDDGAEPHWQERVPCERTT